MATCVKKKTILPTRIGGLSTSNYPAVGIESVASVVRGRGMKELMTIIRPITPIRLFPVSLLAIGTGLPNNPYGKYIKRNHPPT